MPAETRQYFTQQFKRVAVILAAALVLVWILAATKSDPATSDYQADAPAVSVISVKTEAVRLQVQSQGTVTPRTESHLIPQVSGEVVWVSPSLVSGGVFNHGDVLLRIDDRNYRDAKIRAEAALLRAEAEWELALSEDKRIASLRTQNLASESQAQQTQRTRRIAEANLKDAQAQLSQATRDLAHTALTAAFTGRVRSEDIDIGQYVQRGQPVALLYANDSVEVRLPLPDSQLAFLDSQIIGSGTYELERAPEVTLTAQYAGQDFEWSGKIVRTDGEIDARSRMVHVVAQVDNSSSAQPMPVGLFVHAKIEGRLIENAVVIPRSAVRDQNQVLIVDADNRLSFRDVNILRFERESAVINAGLAEGERVCTSFLAVAVEGMPVKPVE